MTKPIILLLAVVMVVVCSAPVSAARPDIDSRMLVTGNEAVNCPPVIDRSSIIVQIINDGGIAWERQIGYQAGDRAAPYVFDDEKIHFELDVSDTDGEIDLAGMEVKVTLSPEHEFLCGLQSIYVNPDFNIYRGHYTGDFTIDSTLVEGKYDISVTVTDNAGATDSYNPETYQPDVDILKPTVTLEKTKSSLTFSSAKPGDKKIPAVENPMGLRINAVIGTEHIPVVYHMEQSGTVMACESNFIPVDGIIWSFVNEAGGATFLSDILQTVTDPMLEGQTIELFYWLNVPDQQPLGMYDGNIHYTSKPVSSPIVVKDVKFEFALNSVTGSGLSRVVTAQMTNTGTADAHNVHIKCEVFSNDSLIQVNGQEYVSDNIGTLAAGSTVTRETTVSVSIIDGLQILQSGARLVFTISSDEHSQTLTYDYQP